MADDVLRMMDDYGYTNEANRLTWCSAYLLGYTEPHYPMPAIIYDVYYQIGDGDYWCGLYNRHLEQTNPMHDDAFVMLWNVHDDDAYKRANRAHLYGVLS